MAAHNHRRTTTQRGLGHRHQALRRALLPHAYGTPCPRCGRLMLHGQELDLDHVELPRALGGRPGTGRMAHRHCNRSAGARLGNALRAARATLPAKRRVQSRRW